MGETYPATGSGSTGPENSGSRDWPRAAGRRVLYVGLPACFLFSGALVAQGQPKPTAATSPAPRALVQKYCVDCHTSSKSAGGFSFKGLDAARPERNAAQWEKALVKLRTGLMPPAGALRPSNSTLQALATGLESRIDRAAALRPHAGAPALHRLNRTEYANSIRDLLEVNVDATALLPADDMSHGFDNMSEVLNVTPTLLAGYVRAAAKISRAAIGDPRAHLGDEIYHLPSTLNQTQHIEGTPFGTRGGIAIRHNFPADGEYIFRSSLYFTTNALLFGATQEGEQLEVAINGERVALFPVNPRMKVDDVLTTPPIPVKAGPQIVTVAFIQKASGPFEDFVQPFDHSLGDLFLGRTQGLTGLPHLRNVAINGPYKVTGVSETPSRRKLLVARPQSANDELPAARQILTNLGRRAYRRPLTEAEIGNVLGLYRIGRERGTFEDGIRLGVQYIVASPQFVFRFEKTPAKVAPGSNFRLTDLELASRLSYFLWSTGPDDRLINLASKGRLKDPAVLEREVRRMIADPRSEELAKNFAGQWLHLRNLKEIQPDLFAYPNGSVNLLNSMRRETELFFWNVMREDRDVTELLTADYSFLNESLAKLYGVPEVEGNAFRKVKLADENRRGLLGQASILTVTSFANRTSPVVRGKWVLDNLLGAPPPVQPPDVPPLKEIEEGSTPSTVRLRLEEHRRNPACASCHTMMDPIGFSLENFDAIGAWRIRDNGFPIDTSGQLVDGTKVNGPKSLQKALVGYSGAFRSTFTQKLLTYALGRGIDEADMPTVRSVQRQAAARNNKFSSYVLGIVKSTPFQMRTAVKEPTQRSVTTTHR